MSVTSVPHLASASAALALAELPAQVTVEVLRRR